MSLEFPAHQPVTLEEVAREAGVSASTVSRYVTGKAKVKESKALLVRAAIDKLGYKPNAYARSLATGSSGIVGILTQDIASPFYSYALTGIERGLGDSGYLPLIVSGQWQSRDDSRVIELFLSRQVEAIIILGGDLADADLIALARQLPLAVLGRSLDLSRYGGASFSLENRQAASQVVQFLVSRGHRRIGHIKGPVNHFDACERFAGYRDGLEECGIPYLESLVVQGDFHETSGLLGVQNLVRQHADMTAVFCGNDQMAYGARLGLYRMGLRVPEDMSLVGFDDLPGSAYTTPPLHSVSQPMREIGEHLARFIVARLNGTPAPEFKPRLQFTLRESVALRRNS